MKLDRPKNENYAAVIARVPAVVPIKGKDRIEIIPIFGSTAIVAKGWKVGDLGVYFPAEVQLSEDYASANNMFRHAENNVDTEVRGYLEDNRRVKAIKLAGQHSNALFMPLSSLAAFGVSPEDVREGDTFDSVNGHEICRKYLIREPKSPNNQLPSTKPGRVDRRLFPEHVSTANYFREVGSLEHDTFVTVTQKLHGTSIRIGRVPVARKLSVWERFVQRLGAKVQTTEFDAVYGSRRVVKDANGPDQAHFYASDIWSLKGAELDGVIPDGYMVFGELVGWTPDHAPIQRGYTYDVPKGRSRLYVYRVATVNPKGVTADLSWPAVLEFCRNHGLTPAPTLWAGFAGELKVDEFINVPFAVSHPNAGAVPLSDPSTVDEGVVIRAEGITPRLLKAKSPVFLEHESKVLDSGAEDLESRESYELAA